MDDVAIIGVGLHPFGRFGAKSAHRDGRRGRPRPPAPTPALEWKDVQFAFGGSFEVDNPDAVVSRLGLTGIPFMDVYNGCATAATALQLTADVIRSGQYELGVAVGMDKHLPGAFTSDPVDYGAPVLVRRDRALPHHQVLRDEDQPLHARPRDLPRDAGPGRGEELPQRRAEPERVPPQADLRGGDPLLADAQLPAHPVHVLLRPTRARRPWCCAGRTSPVATRRPRSTCGPPPCGPAATAPSRCTASWAAVEQDDAPTVYASRAAYEMAGIGPEDVDVIQLQDTDAGAEVIHMAENGFCADGEQEKLIAEGATEIDGPMPVNTDGGLIANGEPIGASGLRQVHELVLQLRGTGRRPPGPGRPQGRLRPALRRARAPPACRSSAPDGKLGSR